MSNASIQKVRVLEKEALKHPQVGIPTHHLIHGGTYVRTILLPAGVLLTGARIKVATVIIVSGDVVVFRGDDAAELQGYHVLAASANRKQAFAARQDTHITMFFPSEAKSVEEAEDFFTDESSLLFSRYAHAVNTINITGE